MLLLLLLPIFVTGFYICTTNPHHAYRVHRYEGQYLYLKTVQLGVFAGFGAALVVLYCQHFITGPTNIFSIQLESTVTRWLTDHLMKISEAEDYQRSAYIQVTMYFIWSFVTFLVGVGWCYLQKLRSKIYEWALDFPSIRNIRLLGELLEDSPLDRLFYRSFRFQDPLLLTLASGKVYVGVVTKLGEPTESEGPNQEIEIVPLMSGYRTGDQRPEFTTDYFQDDAKNPPIATVIPQDSIVIACRFDFTYYKKTQGLVEEEPVIKQCQPVSNDDASE